MRKAGLISLLLMLTAGMLRADNNLMFDKANQLYHNKLYDSAASLYQQMINDGYCHPDLFYNAGNAYYRNNQIGMSIWCYRKAQLLHPHKNISDNLALVKRRIKEPVAEMKDIFFVRWWMALYSVFSMNTWAVLALFSFLLAMLLASLKQLHYQLRLPRRLNMLLFTLSFFSLCMTGVRYYLETYRYHGILLGKDILFRPEEKNATPISLSEGIEVGYRGKGKTGIRVMLPDGRVGEVSSLVFKKL